MLLILAVPALIALLPLLVASERSTIVAASTLTAITALALMSVGILFVPTVVLAWITVIADERSRDSRQPRRSAAR